MMNLRNGAAAAAALIAVFAASAADGRSYYRLSESGSFSSSVQLHFETLSGVLLGGTVQSNVALYEGPNGAPVVARGGSFRTCDTSDCSDGGTEWIESGRLTNGQYVQVRRPGPIRPGERTGTILDVMGVEVAFQVIARDDHPSFQPFGSSDVEPNEIAESPLSRFSGWVEIEIGVDRGEYRVCSPTGQCTPFTSASGPIRHGDQVQLRGLSGEFGESRSMSASAGGARGTFTIRARAKDIEPDAFSFASVNDAEPGTTYSSEWVSLTGHDGVDVSVASGAYQLCATTECGDGGPRLTAQTSDVQAGTKLRLIAVAPDFAERSSVLITAGTAGASFEVRSRAKVTSPEPFSFPSIGNVDPGEIVTSSIVALTGYDAVDISLVEDGAASYRICDTASCSDASWQTSASTDVPPGRWLQLRTTAGAFSETVRVSVTAGARTSTFDVSTRAKDEAPDAFAIPPVSGLDPSALVSSAAVAPVGYDGPVSVTAVGAAVSVANGPFADTASINPGQSFVVRGIASAQFSDERTIRVVVGETEADWQLSTRDRVEDPAAFTFGPNVSNVEPEAFVVSRVAMLRDHDGVEVSITGGEFRLCQSDDCSDGVFGTAVQHAEDGDRIQVRLRTGDQGRVAHTLRLTAGGTTVSWSATVRDLSCATPWGATVQHGASVTAFGASSVPFGGDCGSISETRSCSNGALSGTASYASCTVTPPANCAAPGGQLAHGQSKTFFTAPAVAFGGNCSTVAQTRTCSNGTLSGNATNTSCTVMPAADCTTPWGEGVAHGDSVDAFARSQVAFGETCQSQTRTCSNGTLSGSGSSASCSVAAPSNCAAPGGGTIAHGQSATFYTASSVAFGGSCSSVEQTRTCSNGTLSGSAASTSCAVAAPANCAAPGGGTIDHGESRSYFTSSSVAFGGSCSSQTRTCSNGTLSGSATSESCFVRSPSSCTSPWGSTVAHGSSVTAYIASNVAYGGVCQAQTRSCHDGSLSGSYQSRTCSVAACHASSGQRCSYGISWVGTSHGCGGANCTGPDLTNSRELSCTSNGNGTFRVSCSATRNATRSCNGTCPGQ